MSIVANNRFLMRVNPEIKRAVADSGSSLEHSEIQQLMRQMVDLNIADNLKLWVHSGLVKTRTSGSDLFVPKAYDISGEENDAAQATEANQPELVSLGMEFDGANNTISSPSSSVYDVGTGDITFSLWIKSSSTAVQQILLMDYETGADTDSYRAFFIFMSGGNISFSARTIDGDPIQAFNSYSVDTWYHIVGTRDSGTIYGYINGSAFSTTGVEGSNSNLSGHNAVNIGLGRGAPYNDRFFNGTLNDIRIFNSALSATEITALYNQSKSKYGH